MKATSPNPTAPARPEGRLEAYRARAESALAACLPGDDRVPESLHQAMRYAVLGGGKRMRPLLVYATGEALGVEADRLDPAACAVEMIHAYSLAHDDLPAMDDDELRRGRPTCHVAYGEATAILAGDALQALAFEVLGDGPLPEAVRLRQVVELAAACGARGMAGGQQIDLEAVGKPLDHGALETMHTLKTGALIRASVRMAALAGEEPDTGRMQALTRFGHHVGLAFQVHDDVLDECGSTEALGKTSGADRARDKPTYPAVLGLEAAREHARDLVKDALTDLKAFGEEAQLLRHLARYAIERDS